MKLSPFLAGALAVSIWGCSASPAPSAPVESASQSEPPSRSYKVDELTPLLSSCGKPVSTKEKRHNAYGPDGVYRKLLFRKVEFQFIKNSSDMSAWTLTGVYPNNEDAAADELTEQKLHVLMPCTAKLKFAFVWTDPL